MTAAAIAPRTRVAAWRRTTMGELAAECLGTFILIRFGDGVDRRALPGRRDRRVRLRPPDRDTLIARGERPAPDIEERGRTVEEPF